MRTLLRFATSLAITAACVLQVGLFADEKKAVKVFEIDAALAATDAKDKSSVGGFMKTYKQKLTEGRTYQIDLASKDFDAFLRLNDAKGQMIAEDDDGAGTGTDARS